jgi:hypothetical protein
VDSAQGCLVVVFFFRSHETVRLLFIQKDSLSYDVKILITLPDGESGGSWEEFMAEDFCDEDVLGHVFIAHRRIALLERLPVSLD